MCWTRHLFGPESWLNQNNKPCKALAQVPSKKHAIIWDQSERSGSIVDQIVHAQGVKTASMTAAACTDTLQLSAFLWSLRLKKICIMSTMCVNLTNVLMVLSDLRRPVSSCRLLWLASRPRLASVNPSFATLSCLHTTRHNAGRIQHQYRLIQLCTT